MKQAVRSMFRVLIATTAIWILGSSACADVREWKSKFGSRSVEGEFVALKDGRLTLKKPGGGNLTIPLSALVVADQEFATLSQAEIDRKNLIDVPAALEGKMIQMVDGKATPFALTAEKVPTHFLFYVVSSLCDTCLEHAPRLKEYYVETIAKAPEIELVVISLDSDKEQQQEYLAGQRLPFPAVDFDAMTNFSKAITPRVFSSDVDGCQTFILTTADGKVLEKSALEPKTAIAKILDSNR